MQHLYFACTTACSSGVVVGSVSTQIIDLSSMVTHKGAPSRHFCMAVHEQNHRVAKSRVPNALSAGPCGRKRQKGIAPVAPKRILPMMILSTLPTRRYSSTTLTAFVCTPSTRLPPRLLEAAGVIWALPPMKHLRQPGVNRATRQHRDPAVSLGAFRPSALQCDCRVARLY